MTTGALSRNVSKLLSGLKLVTDNLLYKYLCSSQLIAQLMAEWDVKMQICPTCTFDDGDSWDGDTSTSDMGGSCRRRTRV